MRVLSPYERVASNVKNLSDKEKQLKLAGNDSISRFGDLLDGAIGNLSKLEVEADRLTEKLATGEIEDVHQVMIAAEKAKLAFQFALEVRNKIVNAYKEIMRMPI
ncbi:MAG: flagellar hook-basal body complex protein FliE [bacterium]|nr:flagellar hook-basal body complex protein FliE [bacterium]